MHDLRLETHRHILDHCLGLRLQRAARVVARRLDEALRPLNLTNGQFELLALLRQTPAQGIASVAERLGRDRTTITAILKPLKQRGLVAVTVNPDDSRGRRLSLTRAGRDLLAAAIPPLGSVSCPHGASFRGRRGRPASALPETIVADSRRSKRPGGKMRWLLERMRLYSEALSGIDDLTGEELLQLQARVQLLESEIARLKALVEALRPRG